MPFAVQPVYDAELARRLSRGGRSARPPLAKLRTPGTAAREPALSAMGICLCCLLASSTASWGLRFLTPQMGQ